MSMVIIPIGRILFVNSFMQFAQDNECIITSYFAYRKSIETQEPRQGEEFSTGNDVSSLRYVNEYLFLLLPILSPLTISMPSSIRRRGNQPGSSL
jgi:hypothetical protein